MALRQQLQRSSSAPEPGEQPAEAAIQPLGPDFVSLMHRVGQQAAAQVEQPDQAGKPRRDYETAFGLLDQASKALDALLHRCEHLEAQLVQASDRSAAEIAAAEEVTVQWQKLATAMKTQVEEYERRLGAMRQRAELAEARANAVKERADAAEKVASEKEDLSTRFHDKVVSVFGIGSRVHGVLEAVAKGSITEGAANTAHG